MINTITFAPDSKVTAEMVDAACIFYGLTSPELQPGIAGLLQDWASGKGEMNANLIDAPSRRALFEPVRTSYFVSKGESVAEYSNVADLPTQADYDKLNKV
ncbi:MAG: hypothetical protein KGL39_43960 [Patescibacteria group bacterium]|nr:hypothetical protein [Patescibacteria group bacterium]